MGKLTPRALFSRLKWLDGRPLMQTIEPYREHLFERFSDWDQVAGRYRNNFGVDGRAKKNYKTTDAMLRALHACMDDSPWGNQV